MTTLFKGDKMYKRMRGCLVAVAGLLILYMFVAFGGNKNGEGLPTSRPDVRPANTVVIRSGFVTITPAEGTVYPTATITDTPTDAASATAAPQLTPIDRQIYYTVSTVNLRSCPRTDCPIVEKIAAGQPVGVSAIVVGEEVNAGNPNWYKVEHSAAGDEYAYSRFLVFNPPATISSVQQATAAPVQSVSKPRNCATARAMGLDQFQAAQINKNLDRDGDGKACYDDN